MVYSWFTKVINFWSADNEDEETVVGMKYEDYFKDPHSIEKRPFWGVVTSLKNGDGIVNGDIYFSSDICQFKGISVGTNVSGEAQRENCNEAWRATSVRRGEDFASDDSDENKEEDLTCENILIGKVSNLHEEMVSLSTYCLCINNSLRPFKICVGDWLKCELEVSEKPILQRDILKVVALRQKTIHGSISHIRGGNYIVNGEVLCDRDLLHEHLAIEDQVILKIIESDDGGFSWRAIRAKVDPAMVYFKGPRLSPLRKIKANPANRSEIPFSDFLVQEIIRDSQDFAKEYDVTILGEGEINLPGPEHTDYIKLYFCNQSSNVRTLKMIWAHCFHSSKVKLTVDDFTMNKLPLRLRPEQHHNMVIECSATETGSFECSVILVFDTTEIGKRVKITVGSEPLRKNKFKDLQTTWTKDCGRIIRGEKPFHASHFIPTKLPLAEVPWDLEEMVLAKTNELDYSDCFLHPLAISNYHRKLSHLLFLEEIEIKKQMRRYDMPRAAFSQNREFLSLEVPGLAEKRPSLLVGDTLIASNPVPEGEEESDFGIRYEGCIHEVHRSKMLLKFNPAFHSQYDDEDYAIRFCCNRTPMRRCHLGISLVMTQLGPSVLFPKKFKFQLPQISYIDPELKNPSFKDEKGAPSSLTAKCQPVSQRGANEHPGSTSHREKLLSSKCVNQRVSVRLKGSRSISKHLFYYTPVIQLQKNQNKRSNARKLEWKNSRLNFEQKSAVRRILEGSTRPLPYIIFGPPGTGKTVTLVEAVLQIFLLIPHSRILVVTPSNSASDLITIRLSEYDFITKADLIRLNAYNRSGDGMAEEVVKFSQNISDFDLALHRRIVICTATTSGYLYTARLKNGHFSHVFIDEAGQLTEPESAVPLSLVNSSSGQIVLAGDPKQLGPVVLSSLAKKFGLGESLLSRLCSSALYQPQGMQNLYSQSEEEALSSPAVGKDSLVYEPRLVTLLVKSYRAHPYLLHIPSKLFYHSALVSAADREVCDALLGWPELPQEGFPLIFHGVAGENQQEGSSPSWFNSAELFQVAIYTKSLLAYGVKPDDIGIITPYRKQVEMARRMLAIFQIDVEIKVGSVEEFQGQERKVIIVSTVRSSKDYLQADAFHDIGFVLSRQRFNVAITRAKSLLIVVGNPLLLQMDCHWFAFINFCIDNGGYVGLPLQE